MLNTILHMLLRVWQGVLHFRVITKMTVSASALEINCNESTEGTGLSSGSCTFWYITLAADLFTDKKMASPLWFSECLLVGVWLADHCLNAVSLWVLRSGRTTGWLGFLRSLMECWRSGCPQNTSGCLTWFFTISKYHPPTLIRFQKLSKEASGYFLNSITAT